MRILGPAPIVGKVSTAAIDDDAITEAKVATDAIGLTELKAGTDGNIISFDSSGNPVAIATGNDSQVLTSAGAGNQPAFEDVSAGTKEVFFNPSQGGTGTHQSANVGEFNGWDIDSSGDDYRQNFFIPHDFSSLSELVIVAIADATETMQADLTSEYGAHGEAHTTHTETSANVTSAFTNNEIEEFDVSGVFSSLAANDYCGLTVKGDVNTFHVIGLRMKYS